MVIYTSFNIYGILCQTCLSSNSKKTADKKLRWGEVGREGERKEEWMER